MHIYLDVIPIVANGGAYSQESVYKVKALTAARGIIGISTAMAAITKREVPIAQWDSIVRGGEGKIKTSFLPPPHLWLLFKFKKARKSTTITNL